MAYVDGFVIAVPVGNRQAFLDHANFVDPAFLELGATRVVECWGDDVPDGKQTDFKRAVQCQDGEVVAFAWIEWPDKATRDAALAKLSADPRFSRENLPIPFDGKRMIFGGFETVLDLGK
ncbi:DUF1428 domain-containing protein [Arenimonas sp.]|uniref:DUF1428 domain-containing protein n=1 Tax=Arenimonas sp. TaxID=1872635 RepID=UPI0039E31E19